MWKNLKKRLPDVDQEDLLDLIGLERSRSTGDKLVPALALFGAGVLVGVGLGMMLAPRPGRELRDDLRARLKASDEAPKAPAAQPAAEVARPV